MALWRFQVSPRPDQADPLGRQAAQMLRDFGIVSIETVHTARLFTIELPDTASDERMIAQRIADGLLTDPVTEECRIHQQGEAWTESDDVLAVEVHFKPGVMDNVANSTRLALKDMGIDVISVRTARRYELSPMPNLDDLKKIPRLLGNDCIEDLFIGTKPIEAPPASPMCEFQLRHVPIRHLDDAGLERLSRQGHLFLSLTEMQAVQAYYRGRRRDPTDLELETLAQTWSEHCVHKTLTAAVEYRGAPFPTEGCESDHPQAPISPKAFVRKYDNLLKDTIARATDELIRAGRGPDCLSVFKDNAGVIAFDDDYGIAFKVETHNHPSAIEPYGGSATGTGGVIRDVLGCGLGAKPIANTDVFCVAPPDWPVDAVPKGVIHPKSILKGVVAGVRDYGNRMGIPTVNGAVHFDPRYLGNPLVYCGCVGLIPRDRINKAARPGDAIVLIGGRTGRDGIHGATFSSAELTDTHVDEFAHAVQIGNPIEEKKILDVILQARDYSYDKPATPSSSTPNLQSAIRGSRCLYSAITDCGAGGLSSAVGEMGADVGAEVDLEKVPLKYAGLRYDEIWISEAQERMVLAVPPEDVDGLLGLANSEDVEATVIGRFTDTGRLIVRYGGTEVGRLDMQFLHHGVPRITKHAEWWPDASARSTTRSPQSATSGRQSYVRELKRRLACPTTASKHWIIRQYDHEVQAGSVIKPLVGRFDGPSDAAVIRPRLDSNRGVALGCGLAPQLADVDPYWMAVAAIDEAVRNVVCVGGDPSKTAILDNFSWPRVDDPRSLGALVRACQACYDVAAAYGLPFISGKDSLNNEFALNDADAALLTDVLARHYPNLAATQASGFMRQAARANRLAIPYTLLISAVSLIEDVSRCITMVPRPINGEAMLFYCGVKPKDWQDVRLDCTARLHTAVADVIRSGAVVAGHDCSDGGPITAIAEMAIAASLDTQLIMAAVAAEPDPFAQSTSAYILQASDAAAVRVLSGIPEVVTTKVARMSEPAGEPVFRFIEPDPAAEGGKAAQPVASVRLSDLRHAWTAPLDW